MAWWEETTSYIAKSGLGGEQKPPRGLWRMLNEFFLHELVDLLYYVLWCFTHLYLLAIAVLYLGRVSEFDTIAAKLIRALAEPYLGAVGIYTILKEARKRRYGVSSRHSGEVFVIFWILLLVASSFLALLTEAYTFTKTLELIITLSLSVGIIYVGGVIHKP